jgi:hypothetical protein
MIAEIALRDRGVAVGTGGRAEHLREVVINTVDEASLGQELADLSEGSGGELKAAGTRPRRGPCVR